MQARAMIRLVRNAALLIFVAGGAAARGPDHSAIYSRAELGRDGARLAKAVRKLDEIIRPYLTAREALALQGLEIDFPAPQPGDHILNFYAYGGFGERVVAMPILSLKALEDVTTAYAYLLVNAYHPGTIDLYFAMLQREDPSSFPGGRYPALSPALGIPEDAWRQPGVDALSLRLRNEALAFVYFHELAHIILDHGSEPEASPAETLAEEIAADALALDLLARTDTPALGASLLFQAYAFALPNRGRFDTDAAWLAFQRERATHPIPTARLRAFAATTGAMAARRPAEAEIWRFIGGGLRLTAETLSDPEMQICMNRVADRAPISALKLRRAGDADLFRAYCR